MMKKSLGMMILILGFMSFVAHSETLNTGPWRFVVKNANSEVPFIITLKKSNNRFIGVLHNGKERIPLNEMKFTNDELVIPLQTYDMTLEMKLVKKDIMNGFLIRHNKNPKVQTPVVAVFGEKERFPEEKSKPEVNLNGKWSITMTDEEGAESKGVAVFEQQGNNLYGSILTPTGDYRYFEGFVSKNEFEAASFDGVFNNLIQGKMQASIRSNSITKFEGTMDPQAALPDPYAQTQVSHLDFSFPDLKGKNVSLNDPQFKNKPVVIQIFGSWCPNCHDEMNFLIPWYKNNKQRGVEVIALAFERSLSKEEALVHLKKVQKKKAVPYTLLIAGYTAEDKPMNKLPGIKNFISFPTTIFLNKKHEVVKVHAGFTGPGTGDFYDKWKGEFTQTVAQLLK